MTAWRRRQQDQTRVGRTSERRRSIRLKLTFTYGLLFLVGGLILITITYLLMSHARGQTFFVSVGPDTSTPLSTGKADLNQLSPHARALADQMRASAERQRQSDLDLLLIQAGIALGITTVVALAAGWFVAGRALRPLRVITAATKEISQHTLHERLSLSGARDEVRDLADTIDGLLARIETAFHAQRRFVANASHELRTPLTWDRALIEVTLSNPDATMEDYRSAHRELLTSTEEKERLIEALLTLATSERGLTDPEQVDLAELVRETTKRYVDTAERSRIALRSAIEPAAINGNHDLVKRLIENLLENAVRYNHPDGSIDVEVRSTDAGPVLAITNTGPLLADDDIDRIQEPFHRLEPARSSENSGHGLGLSIVAAIAAAHAAAMTLRPRETGGLIATIAFPPTPTSARHVD